MAQETRAQLYAKILANLPDNTTEQITPATDRAVEDAEVESCYNLLDDDATNVNYNPTTVADWGATVPAEVGDGLDILIKKVSTNASQNIAYVSTTGSDVVNEYEIGNPLKPFATFGAAINAVSPGGTVKALGGSYDFTNETVFSGVVIITNTGVTLDISFCQIAGRFSINKSNTRIIATGATITNNTSFPLFNTSSGSYSNFQIIGGDWDAGSQSCVTLGSNLSNCIIRNATFTSNINGDVVRISSNDTTVIDCVIKSTNTGNPYAFRAGTNVSNLKIQNTDIEATTGNGVGMNPSSELSIKNCEIKGGGYGIILTTTAGAVMDLIVEDSTIVGSTNHGVYLNQICDNVRFTRCVIVAQDINKESVLLETSRTTGKDTLFEYCTFFTGSSVEVFNQSELDTSVTYVNKCSFNKNAFTYTSQIIETDTCYQPNTPLIIQ